MAGRWQIVQTESAITAILNAKKLGDFKSFTDFMRRVDLSKVNKKVVESLIKAGALDRWGNRAQLLSALPTIRENTVKLQKGKDASQVSLFSAVAHTEDVTDNLPDVKELPLDEKLKLEKELLGFYLTDHPVKKIMRIVANQITHKINQLDPTLHLNQQVTIAGVVSRSRLVNTKKNNSKMAFISLEDDTKSIDCVVFPKLYAENPLFYTEDTALVVKGKVDNRDDKIQIVVDSVSLVDTKLTPQDMIHEIFVRNGTPKERLQKVSELLKSHPGYHEIIIAIESGNNLKKIILPYKVDYTPELELQVEKTLLG